MEGGADMKVGNYSFCDKCGDPIEYGLVDVSIIYHITKHKEFELCPKCAKKWETVLTRFTAAQDTNEQRKSWMLP